MPQLQINQGAQDALLYDNTKSYFTNVGYTRTSNFQVEYRDIDPQNSGKQLGTTVQFVIPKAADLLGCTDLMVDFAECSGGGTLNTVASWVECIGYAMIDKVVFSIGPNDIETVTGEQLYIQNELMRGNNARYDKIIGKTGRSVLETECATTGLNVMHTIMPHSNTGVDGGAVDHITEVPNHRVIHDGKAVGTDGAVKGRKLTIPLGLFFTKSVGNYFPLSAVAGCNEIRIAIHLRPYAQLVQLHPEIDFSDGAAQAKVLSGNNRLDGKAAYKAPATALPTFTDHFKSLQLRCHYVHVTGGEATTLMNKEHVRLLKLWQANGQVNKTLTHTVTPASGNIGDLKKGQLINIDLSFLHPVSELIIVARRATDMNSEQTCSATLGGSQKAKTKGRFNFHGDGREPSMDHPRNSHHNPRAPGNSTMLETPVDPATGAPVESATITMKSLKLSLNGQERHPGMTGSKVDIEYLRDRIVPMLHSNTSSQFESGTNTGYMGDETVPAAITGTEPDFGYEPVGVKRLSQYLHQMQDRKNIFVYPFSINPEGANPSGAVNFSKVSHAKLTIEFDSWSSTTQEVDWVFDVYGTYYNWLQLKDGRGLLSFA